MAEISKRPSRSPHITGVLEEAAEDLKYAEFPGYVGKVFNPVRDKILLPATNKATDIVPIVASLIPLPFVDEVGAFALNVPINAMRLGYSILPHPEVDKESEQIEAQELKMVGEAAMRKYRPNPFTSSLMGVVGFAANTALDIATLPFSGKMGDWLEATIMFIGYLAFSGIGGEALAALANTRALENLLIIGRVQAKHNEIGVNTRRARTAMDCLPPTMEDGKFKEVLTDASVYVKCATAAYGATMIDSADLLQVFGKKVVVYPLVEGASETARRRKISRYIGVHEDDIVDLVSPGGSMDVIGYFLTVDHRKKKVNKSKGVVILAIRGTFTISGLKVDAEAYGKTYLDGKAHSGMADVADQLWDHVKSKVVKALLDNPGYDLVITGHSLGAGTAALISLKVNYESLLARENSTLKDVAVSCFAFAPPPVYFQSEKNEKMQDAMDKIFAFIHENDVVPFMSWDSFRRLFHTIEEVDKFTKLQLVSRPLMAAGLKGIPEEVEKAVMDDHSDSITAKDGAEKMAIPAPCVFWMRAVDKDKAGRPVYNVMFCRPESVAGGAMATNDLNCLLDPKMISDHMNPQYERAVFSVREQMLKKKPGFVFPESRDHVW